MTTVTELSEVSLRDLPRLEDKPCAGKMPMAQHRDYPDNDALINPIRRQDGGISRDWKGELRSAWLVSKVSLETTQQCCTEISAAKTHSRFNKLLNSSSRNLFSRLMIF